LIVKPIVFIALLLTFAVIGFSQSLAPGSCSYLITGNNLSYRINKTSSCGLSYNFSAGSANNRLVCRNSTIKIGAVIFSNNTYNNTIVNCTFSNAVIKSMHNAQNNLLSPAGNYSTYFTDNSSNIAVGYYFNFITRNAHGALAYAGFVTIVPEGLHSLDAWLVEQQQITLQGLRSLAAAHNYTLPRFGYYATVNSSTGVMAFPLETTSIYRNRTVSYNPYWLMCPYWGFDELSFKTFTINSDMNFTPTLIYPEMREHALFPDNATIYWNFSILHYSNFKNITAYIFSGWQSDSNNKIVNITYNLSGNFISYKAGEQKPGIYEFIGVLKSPESMEHDNSTTDTYSVGLSYCPDTSALNISGYYTMPYNSLKGLYIFSRTNATCITALPIDGRNITVNCKGGSINSTMEGIYISNSRNITIINCRIFGNAIVLRNSSDIIVQNSSLIANNFSNIAVRSNNSVNIYLLGDRISGYLGVGNITYSSNTTINNITGQNQNSQQNLQIPVAAQNGNMTLELSNTIRSIKTVLCLILLFLVFYVLVCLMLKMGKKSKN
jgi:hypothetical protein